MKRSRTRPDEARLAAYEVLRQVQEDDAYANLALPHVLRRRRLTGRDAAFATELVYGSLRMQGRYDAIAEIAADRPIDQIDPPLRILLRLGIHQLEAMRVPPHAALAATVDVARDRLGGGRAGFVNAVLRKITGRTDEDWTSLIAEAAGSPDAQMAVLTSHPEWIVRAYRDALVAHGRDSGELEAALQANNATPNVTLVARPGLADPTQLLKVPDTAAGRFSPYAVVLQRGDPAAVPGMADSRVGVQDEGSQLAAIALADVPAGLIGAPKQEQWLDIAAGPGGKAALLGAIAGAAGHRLLANEIAPHRAELVEHAVAAVNSVFPGTVIVRTDDGRNLPDEIAGQFDRVLLDAPCTGLGALRRRPEARWRRTPGDLAQLTVLQRDLLAAALALVRPGGVVAYVTCSPHVAETLAVVSDSNAETLDTQQVLAPYLGERAGVGPHVQLWPHIHGTDAMFIALLRRSA